MTRKTSTYARRRTTRRADGISTTRMFNTRLTPQETARILVPCKAALAAMQKGQASFSQWLVLCTAVHVAQAIEDCGVIKGQADMIQQARAALEDIGERAAGPGASWTPPTCYGQELAALQDLVNAHSRQVHELIYGEYTAATRLAESRVLSIGGGAFRIEPTAQALAT
jgi:hypothetical protein